MKNVDPQAAVAIILALAVLFFVVNSTLLRPWLTTINDPVVVDPAVTQAWKDIINVIIGALAGFIGGAARTKHHPPPEGSSNDRRD